MIGSEFQNCGFGKVALIEFLTYFTNEYPEVTSIYTSAEVKNTVAVALYKSMKFKELEVFEYDFQGNHFKEIRMLLTIN